MSTTQIKEKIVKYISTADERFLKMVYALLREYESTETETHQLSKAQLLELDRRWKNHVSGKSPNYTIEQAKQIVRSARKK